jgi:putative FmdB family regulatory protein
MPIYEYRCEDCGHELEALQKVSDAPLTDCPACGRPALKKLISAAGFRLKGGGWYETDFKQGNKKNLHDTGEKKTEAKESKSESKPESTPKPAEKAKAAPAA